MTSTLRIGGRRSALVLAAHGSRHDPAVNALVRRYASLLGARGGFDEAVAAFHQGEPTFAGVLDELAADDVTVVPFLTSDGYYADVVLANALRESRRFADVRLSVTPPVGTHASVPLVVGRRIADLAAANGLDRGRTTAVLIGHGTPKHPESRTSTLTLASALARRQVVGDVRVAFLDDEPRIEQAVGELDGQDLIVIPFLIGGGAHTIRDLPAAFGLTDEAEAPRPLARRTGGRLVVIDRAFGESPAILDILAELADEHRPSARKPAPKSRGRAARRPAATPGTVHLVGAGPGDAGLITVRGLELLRRAQVVIHDRLVGRDLLDVIPADAEVIDAGKSRGEQTLTQKRINSLLVRHAREGRTVVRLKGGDPFVFGRGSEELDACQQAGIPVSVVPGVSSAVAAPAAAGIPVTARGIAASFAVLTAHRADDVHAGPDLAALAAVETLVILMGRDNLAEIAARLIAAGRAPETPAACIQEATTPNQRVALGTLATIAQAADRAGLVAPAVTVVGAVAALARTVLPYARLAVEEVASA